MTSIWVVGSVHEEKGLASVAEGYRILEQLRPEVIFLEVPTSLNEEQVLSGLRETLESKTVGLYSKIHPVELVPVDLPTPEMYFFTNNGRLLSRIERASREYCRLIDLHGDNVRRYGFAYLNSGHCDEIFRQLYREMEATVRRLDEHGLTDLLKTWDQMIERRDIEMLKNIRARCEAKQFERGVFLVGAAHRRSLMAKLESEGEATFPEVEWKFLDGMGDT